MSLESTLLQYGVPPRYAVAARSMIGKGTEGAVYLLDGGRYVLKVNVDEEHKKQAITKLARRVKGRAWATQIEDCGKLRPPGHAPYGFWYVMELMLPVDAREKRVLDCAGFAIMAAAKGQMAPKLAEAKWRQAVALLPTALQETLRKARAAGYHDLHGGNVMKTSEGAYKVIDVESLRPLKRGH